ncbi:MAG: hypothetical protein ACR2LQ_14245 [Acidimicrobiales bacterium]
MAAPEFVPIKPTEGVRAYASPPRRPDSWRAERPGDLGGAGQPHGDAYGNQGPDQGYVLGLVRRFDGVLHLASDEHRDDVAAGAVTVALKRASLFGRAPVMHDVSVAYTVWGFLDDHAAGELVGLRTKVFAGVAHAHHYDALRRIADSVPDATLRLTPQQVAEQHATSWRSLLVEAPPPSV